MKKCFMILVILILSNCVQAQTWEEWTKQKKTQIKYLLQQIAALKVYGDQLKVGYDIVDEGLTTIHCIKQGDFSLHEGFFAALKIVNPKIKTYPKLAPIISMQASIVKECKNLMKWAKEGNQFNEAELSYISKVTSHLIDGCTNIIDALILFTTDDMLELKDDERINRIDALYANIQDQYQFVQHFQKEIKIMVTQRLREQKEVDQSRLLHGMK